MEREVLTLSKEEAKARDRLVNDPIYFFEKVLNFKRQPIIKKYRGTHWSKWKAHMFGICEKEKIITIEGEEFYHKWSFPSFKKGEMLTWQQLMILESIKESCAKDKYPKMQVSIASGRGVGKSFLLAGLIVWSIIRKKNVQGAITAPSATQLQDASWARLGQIIQRAKEHGGSLGMKISKLFKKTTERLQMVGSEDKWFISAKVGRKENPEALAGMHSDEFVALFGDEASAVPKEIFEKAEGGLTDESYIFMMISNYTRLDGYFHDSFKANKKFWTNISLSGEESPLTNHTKARQFLELNGRDSYIYRVEILGKAPKEGIADDDGWITLFMEDEIRNATTQLVPTPFVCGVDPAGEGKDSTSHVARDNFIMKQIRTAKIDTPKTIANAIVGHHKVFNIPYEDFIVDSFGSEEVLKEVALADMKADCTGIHWGRDKLFDKTKFLNTKARLFHDLQQWIKKGGKLHGTYDDWKDLMLIKYSVDGNIFRIMSKEIMRRKGMKSPDNADAAALTFYKSDYDRIEEVKVEERLRKRRRNKTNIFEA